MTGDCPSTSAISYQCINVPATLRGARPVYAVVCWRCGQHAYGDLAPDGTIVVRTH